MRRYVMPSGVMVNKTGAPNPQAKDYLSYIENVSKAVNAIENLDAGTGYTAAQLRDKIREILIALQG